MAEWAAIKSAEPNRQEFDAKLELMGFGGGWTCIRVPFSVEEVFGSKARVPVKGTINGFSFRTSLFPMGG